MCSSVYMIHKMSIKVSFIDINVNILTSADRRAEVFDAKTL